MTLMNVSLNVPKLGTQGPGPGVRSHNALFTGCLCPGHKAAWLKTRRGDIFSEEIVKVRQLMRAAWVLAGTFYWCIYWKCD